MPSFMTLPASLANRPLLVPGRPQYLFGGYSATTSPTQGYITNISASVNTVTISVVITSVPPTTAQLITVQGASNSAINAIGATVTGVTGFNTGDLSTGTISYTVNAVGTIASAAGSGTVVLPVAETADALTSNLISQQVTVPFNDPRIDQARTVTAQVSFPSLPTSVVVTLQDSDDDQTYYDVAAVASVAGGTLTGGFLQVQNSSARFYRLSCGTVVGGSSPTIIGKVSA
jgi:hypothetical protein